MCALFGFLDYGKKISFLTKKKLIRELSVAAESRGTDATGIAYVKNKELTIFKKASIKTSIKRPERFSKLASVASKLLRS